LELHKTEKKRGEQKMSKTESYCARCKRGMLARRVTQNKVSFERGRKQGAMQELELLIDEVEWRDSGEHDCDKKLHKIFLYLHNKIKEFKGGKV